MATMRFRDYSFRPVDDIDLTKDDQETQAVQERTRQYAALKPFVNLEELIEHACSKLPEMVPIIAMAQEVLEVPPDPQNPRAHVQDLIRVGQAVLNALTEAADEQISVVAVTHGRD